MNLIEKIEAKLIELGIVELAEAPVEEAPVESGATEEVVVEVEMPKAPLEAVLVDEIIPNPIKISYSAIGAPVIAVDADGKEENLMDGEYKLATNKKLMVADGKLTAIEDIVEEEKEEEIEMEIETPSLDMAMGIEGNRLKDIIDMSKKGDYTIQISVDENGVVTFGTVYANTFQNLLLAEEEKVNLKVEELTKGYESIIEALKVGETKVVEKPEVKVQLSRAELLKANIRNK